jgi:CheY-like chemotaxis protein
MRLVVSYNLNEYKLDDYKVGPLMSSQEKTVLIVEDDQATLEVLLSTIEDVVGARAIGAEDGDIALDRVIDLSPDLIILDLRLPRLNGWQVLAELKGNPTTSSIPVIVVTTAILGGGREKALDAGAADFLAKPFDLFELEEKVRRYLLTPPGSSPFPPKLRSPSN